MKQGNRVFIRRLSAAILAMALAGMGGAALAGTAVPQAVLDAAKSVVRIEAEYVDGYSVGSGFVVKSDEKSTVVATNWHVVSDDPLGISVWLSDDEKISARIHDDAEQKDLCLLELKYPVSARALPLNDRGAAQGDAVFAVGFPAAADYLSDTEAHAGEAATITDGIVSAVRSVTVVEHGPTLTMLQINVDINPGNSGGPLFAADGTVVGINTYGVTQGINGAIDVSELIKLMRDNKLEHIVPGQQTGIWIWFVVGGAVLLAAGAAVFLYFRKRNASRAPRKTRKGRGKAVPLRAYMAGYPHGLGAYHATSLLMPVALQLRDLHHNGALHLQVSPDSVLVQDGRAALKPASGLEADRYISGYAAPEVYRGKGIGHASDVYSFCALLYFAASGITPPNALGRDADTDMREAGAPEEGFFAILSQGMSLEADARMDGMQALIYRLSPYNTAAAVPHARAADAEGAKDDASAEARERQDVGEAPAADGGQEDATGQDAAEQGESPPPAKKPKKRGRRALVAVAIAVFALLALAFGAYHATYRQTVKHAEAEDFEAARRYLLLPGITRWHDENLPLYVDAGLFLEQRDFWSAYVYFGELSGYRDADALEMESLYRHAAQLADDGRFDEAIKTYRTLERYKYKDAASLIPETKYRKGVYTLYEREDYKRALAIFEELDKEGYEKAGQMCHETNFLWALAYLESDDYVSAYARLGKAKGYPEADEAIAALKPMMYEEAQKKYRQGDNYAAKELFTILGEYERCEDYLFLLQVKSSIDKSEVVWHYHDSSISVSSSDGMLTFEEWKTKHADNRKTTVDKLKGMIGFEDAADIIVEAHNLATEFLRGMWRTSDGKYFEMKAEDRISYNLPWFNYGDYYAITDGNLIYHKESNEYDNRVVFQFTVENATTIKIYCTQDGKTYTLTKR